MAISISPTESDVLRMLRAFLLQVLPAGIEVIKGQDNRVSEPQTQDFVVMTPRDFSRLGTNVDAYVDCYFTAALNNGTMTVSAVAYGSILIGSQVFGVNVSPTAVISRQVSGTPGGIGTYAVGGTDIITSEPMASGTASLEQDAKCTVQVDVHGPNSANNAQIISTAFRDEYATDFFAAQSPPLPVTPLYADDPKQIPFLNENQQIEWRWVLDACMEVDQTLLVGQQFMDAIKVLPVVVEVAFPVT